MRRVPRPQVRPVHAARLLFHEGLLRGHQGDWPGARPRQERVGIVTGAAHSTAATAVRRTERAPRPNARTVGRETGEPGPAPRGMGEAVTGPLRIGRTGLAVPAAGFRQIAERRG